MPGLALFLTLVLAHGLMLVGRELPLSPFTPLAFFWQDALIALGYGLVASRLRRPAIAWGLYALLVVWAAINVAVVQVVPSPLTPAMLRAARGTLADSIAQYVTLTNLALVASVIVAGTALRFALARLPVVRPRALLPVLAIALVASGPFASRQLDTGGWHRNAFGALLPSRAPTAALGANPATWRASPRAAIAEAGEATDLTALRGAAAGRNVVLVILESVGASYLAPYGADSDPMPNLTRLAAAGLRFESAYAAYPESIKGFFAVLCSRHPALGISAERHAAAACDSLAEALRVDGYRTALFHSGRFDYLGMRDIVAGRGFETLADAGVIGGRQDSSFGIDEASTVESMLDWIDAGNAGATGAPFFLTYLPIAGHHPYATTAPGPFDPVDERHRYLNAIHEADRALGQLVAGIAARGLAEDTVYVIFGDHGEAFGQHAGNIGHSFFLYEENVRVPFVIVGAGIEPPVEIARTTISLVDTAPTLIDLLGMAPAMSWEGRSALAEEPLMAFFLTDYARHWLGLVDGCHKYLFELTGRRGELYQVCEDPGERRNLAPSLPEAAAAYRRHLESWAAAVRAGLRAPVE